MGEQALALVERRQPKGRNVRLEVPHRMRIEGRDDHRLPHMEAHGDRPAHHRLVAEVEAVEVAERDDRAAKLIGNGLVVVQPLHRALAVSAHRCDRKSVRGKMLPKQPVLMHRKDDHECVENRKQDQAEILREGVAIELVGDERAEDDEAGRVGP